MGKKTDFETPSILKRLFLFFPAFYIAFFLTSIIVNAGAKQPITPESVFTTPFNWQSFSPAGTVAQLIPWITLLVTFVFWGPLLIFVIVQNTKQVWDFAVTITFFHWVVTCLVTLSFPVNYIWWVTFLPCGLLMSTGGELSCYYLRDMREIQLDK